MTNIWDKKPKVKTGHSIFHGYSAPEMDVWLENLKTQINEEDELIDIFIKELKKENEAIKRGHDTMIKENIKLISERLAVVNKVKEWYDTHSQDKHVAPSILEELADILEIQGCT